MTENLTDAEFDALEAEHENCCETLSRYVAECLRCNVAWPCPTGRALAELREWHAQFGPDPSRWHKVWEVGPMRVGPLCPDHPAATQGNPNAREVSCGECDWKARPDHHQDQIDQHLDAETFSSMNR